MQRGSFSKSSLKKIEQHSNWLDTPFGTERMPRFVSGPAIQRSGKFDLCWTSIQKNKGGHVPRLAKNICNVIVQGSPDNYRDPLSTIVDLPV